MNETVDPDVVARARPAVAPVVPANPVAPKRRRLGKIVFVLGLAAAALLAWQYLENIAPSTRDASRKAEAPSGPPPQTVRAAPATTGEMPITIDALGTVTSLATVTVKTQIAGRLMEVGYKEGQLVKAGDFLIQIDPRPFEATLAQAQAQLAKDTSLYQQAQSDLARYQTLNRQDSIARQQVEDQVFLVAQDKAAMSSDQAQIDAAKLNIGYTHIVSPITGRVGLRLVDPGNYVQPSDANGLVVITQLDPISVIFSTPEDNLPRITRRLEAGAKLRVTAFDRANVKQLAVGELTTFDNEIDTTTGTFKLRASFANPDNALFPNQFVNARLLVDTETGVVLVPNAAVQLGQNGSFVYVVKTDDTVAVRQVATGASDTARTVITSGLQAGEQVVTDGVDRLRDGAKIRLATANADAGTAPSSAGTPPEGSRRRHQKGHGGDGAKPAATP
jgi:multidrug efflux system membrane fusion protein